MYCPLAPALTFTHTPAHTHYQHLFAQPTLLAQLTYICIRVYMCMYVYMCIYIHTLTQICGVFVSMVYFFSCISILSHFDV